MHILTYTVLDYIDILPVLFKKNLFNILNDDFFRHTCLEAATQVHYLAWDFLISYLLYVKEAFSYVHNHDTNNFLIFVQVLQEAVSVQWKQATKQKPLLSLIELFKIYE